MRLFLILVCIFGFTAQAMSEEDFELTRKELSKCIAENLMATSLANQKLTEKIKPSFLDKLLRAKCGELEDKQRKEFIFFLYLQIGKTLTKEAATIIGQQVALPYGETRKIAVEAYARMTGQE